MAFVFVLLPCFSAAFAKYELTRYNALLDNGLRLVVLLAIPAAVGLGLMAEALVAFLYQGKNFLISDVHQTSLAVMGYSFGLLGLIAIKILAPAFYARKDIRTPVKVAAVSLVCVQLCNLIFVPYFAHAGLALSVGVGSCINAATLLVILFRRGQYAPVKGWGIWFARVILATLAMSVAIVYLQAGVDWAGMQSELV